MGPVIIYKPHIPRKRAGILPKLASTLKINASNAMEPPKKYLSIS